MFNLKKLNLRTLLRKSSNSINKNFSINKKPPKQIGNDNSDKKKQVKRENAHLEEDNNDDFKEATENFLKNINRVEGEDSKEIESFIKNFNNKLYKQNEQLTLKIGEMFENSDQKSHLLIFTAINEINKVNLSNTSKLLKIFLIESLRSREISLNNNKSNGGNYPWLLLILFGTLGYLFFYYSTHNYNNLAFKLQDSITKSVQIKSDLENNIKLPLYEKITIPTTLGNTSQIKTKNLILYGRKGIGKSVSLKAYCLKELEKENTVVYVDLQKSIKWENINSSDDLLKEVLFKNFDLNEEAKKYVINKWLTLNEGRQVQFVFDNFNSENDLKLLSLLSNLNYQIGIKTIICTNTVSKLNLNIKFISDNFRLKQLELNESNFEKYILDKVNKYIKNNSQKLNCDKFTNENLVLFKEAVGKLSFYSINDFLENNSTINEFNERCQEIIKERAIGLRMSNFIDYPLVKEISKQSVVKITKPVSIDLLEKLESIGWVSFVDSETYFNLNTRGFDKI